MLRCPITRLFLFFCCVAGVACQPQKDTLQPTLPAKEQTSSQPLSCSIAHQIVEVYPDWRYPYLIAGGGGYVRFSDMSVYLDAPLVLTLFDHEGNVLVDVAATPCGSAPDIVLPAPYGFRVFHVDRTNGRMVIHASVLSLLGQYALWTDITQEVLTEEEAAWATAVNVAGFSEDRTRVIFELQRWLGEGEGFARRFRLVTFDDAHHVIASAAAGEAERCERSVWSAFTQMPMYGLECTSSEDGCIGVTFMVGQDNGWNRTASFQTHPPQDYAFHYVERVLEHRGMPAVFWKTIHEEEEGCTFRVQQAFLTEAVSPYETQTTTQELSTLLDLVEVNGRMIGIRQGASSSESDTLVELAVSDTAFVLADLPGLDGMTACTYGSWIEKVDERHFATSIEYFPRSCAAEGNGHVTTFFVCDP